ncbi:MAG: lipopolysaccharide biosynthesis protein [Clostridia bacterium]
MDKNKGLKNIVFSFFSQIIILLLGFFVPRVILTNYGSDTNGVTNTITQIFTYLALLEAGIAQATTNSLYPFINDIKKNKENISKIMSISRRYFRKISYIYAIIVIFVSFAMPLCLKTSLPYWTICLYILLEGIISLISFYFIQCWNALLQVDGKSYVISNIDLIYKILCNILKIILAINGINIIFIQCGCLIISLIKLIIYHIYINKRYKWIKFEKVNSNEKLENRNSFVISEIAWTIFSSTDMIILSIFCSTQFASIYSIYNMVYLAINSLLNSIFNSLKYMLGQLYFEDKIKYTRLHDLFNSIFMGIMTLLMCVTYFLILPFIELYTKGVNDINYIYKEFPLLFCLIQLLSWSRFVPGNLTAIAGYAKKISYVSIIEATLNLVLSLILVRYYSITGVLLATVFALPLKVIYCNWLSDKIILKRRLINSIKILGINWLVFIVTVLLFHNFELQIKTFGKFIFYGMILTIIYFIIIILLNCIVNKDVLESIKNMLKRERNDKNGFK